MLRSERNGLAKCLDGLVRSSQRLQYGALGVVRERIGGEALHEELRVGKRIGRAPVMEERERTNLPGLVAVGSGREGAGGEVLGFGPSAGLHRLVRLLHKGIELRRQGQGKQFRVKEP